MTRFRTCATVQGTILRYDQPNEEKIDDIEDGDTPHHLFRGPWDLLSWICRFRSSQSGQLRASVGESRSDENAAETVEAIQECSVR